MERSEFSRIIEVNDGILEKTFTLEPTRQELQALAERFEIHDVKSLDAKYIITRKTDIDGAYLLSCELSAEVIKFVVEGRAEPFQIEDSFDVVLLDEHMARNNYEQLQDFDIEIFDENKRVDVGEIVSQYLSLCIFM